MGMKMSDLASDSYLARSANTAIANPTPVAMRVTANTHHRLLAITPRKIVKNTMTNTNTPIVVNVDDAPDHSSPAPRWRPV